ncbi:ABC transporter permease [Paenibacillus sp. 1001270B_150601_E10]|uniref:ABC transporter permease n=1 Tax=Paenibacillus sp. 1001270B_150601_E10 TaxID=2787079 RepID=UPI00189DBA9C|nr:ABC-2 family transporter protein [Paenibacillus sp. 1001270B_150601_E10]
MALYFRYMIILLKSQLQYRASFIMLTIGQCFTPLTSLAAMYFLFERFGQIKGWTYHEVALCFAVTYIAFSITECFARGFDTFSSLVRDGEFDRLLLRPRSTVLQVLGSKFEFSRIGRLGFSIGLLIWAMLQMPTPWTTMKLATLILMIAGGIIIYLSIFIMAATLSFWTIQGIEIVNVLTDGGREMTQYPLSIYHKNIRRFFTFIIPFACVNYLPLMVLVDHKEAQPFYSLLPLVSVLLLIPSIWLWRFGVRHYRSTGS